MKICFIGMEIVPVRGETFVGGLVNNVVRLAKELSSRGHEVHIVTSDIKDILKNTVSFSWARLYPIHLHGEYASSRSGLEFLLKVVPTVLERDIDCDFDILHVHSAYPLLAPIGGFLGFARKMPAVFSLYSPIQTSLLRDRKGMYQSLSSLPLSRMLFTNVRKIIAISHNIERSLIHSGISNSRIEMIPPIVDTAYYDLSYIKFDKRKELGIPRDAPVVLYIGNWAKWKGIDFLLEAVANMKDKFPNIRLITAWGEPYSWYNDRKELIERRIVELGLSETVVQVGIVSDLPSLIHSSNVVAEPFLNTDGVADLPLTILESMACRKPVVSTRVAGIPEIVNDGKSGLLVSPGDSHELANALTRILRSKEDAARMGHSASDFVCRNYSPEIIVDKLEVLYNNILAP